MKLPRFIVFILLFALFCTVLGAVFYSVFSFTQRGEPLYTNTLQATEIPEPTNVLIELVKKDGKVSIASASLLAGKNLPLTVDAEPEFYIDQIFEEKNVSTTPLDFSQYETHQESLENPTTVLILPYYPYSDLQIRDNQSGESYVLDKNLVIQALNAPPPPPIDFEIESVDTGGSSSQVLGNFDSVSDGYLDIVFVSSNFTDQETFNDYVAAYSKFIVDFDPFKLYKDKIRVTKLFTTADLKCTYRVYPATEQQNIFCNPTVAYQLLSQIPWDIGVVLDDSGKWGAVAHYNQIINMGMVAPNILFTDNFAHEMGHAVGRLSDEYTYDNSTGTENPANLGPNCDVAGCPKWANIAGTQCIPGCTYRNAYRSSQDSLMNHFGPFNTVSRNALIAAMDMYTTLPDLPATPRVTTGCMNAKVDDYNLLGTPFIDITWSQNDLLETIELSTTPNFLITIQANAVDNPEAVTNLLRQNNVTFEEYTLTAPKTFITIEGRPVKTLEENITYYVRFRNDGIVGESVQIKTRFCSEKLDLNEDGALTLEDYEFMKTSFGQSGEPGFNKSDFGLDGIVDLYDFNFFLMKAEYYFDEE